LDYAQFRIDEAAAYDAYPWPTELVNPNTPSINVLRISPNIELQYGNIVTVSVYMEDTLCAAASVI
jgi:hypothetical protein